MIPDCYYPDFSCVLVCFGSAVITDRSKKFTDSGDWNTAATSESSTTATAPPFVRGQIDLVRTFGNRTDTLAASRLPSVFYDLTFSSYSFRSFSDRSEAERAIQNVPFSFPDRPFS